MFSLHPVTPKIAYCQRETNVECGQILEREFTDNVEAHVFLLYMEIRESFDVSLEPFGDYLQTAISIYGLSGIRLGRTNVGSFGAAWVTRNPSIASGILSAKGFYKIRVTNANIESSDSLTNVQSGIGNFTLSIGCTTSDGTKIEPGDIVQPTPAPAPLPTPTPRSAIPDTAPAFTGTGFPGLVPVDFSTVAQVRLLLDTVMTGVIPTGDTLDLSYTRVSGNMNLGLVVLSEKNEVFFQASLGVFRISLVEPDEVAPTVFQLRGSIVAE